MIPEMQQQYMKYYQERCWKANQVLSCLQGMGEVHVPKMMCASMVSAFQEDKKNERICKAGVQ